MCGHGVVSDMVLTGRPLSAEEALAHGVISRIVAPDELEATALAMAHEIAGRSAVAVKMARRVVSHLVRPTQLAAMEDELIYQTFINKSEDYAELRAAHAEGRDPVFRGS